MIEVLVVSKNAKEHPQVDNDEKNQEYLKITKHENLLVNNMQITGNPPVITGN